MIKSRFRLSHEWRVFHSWKSTDVNKSELWLNFYLGSCSGCRVVHGKLNTVQPLLMLLVIPMNINMTRQNVCGEKVLQVKF